MMLDLMAKRIEPWTWEMAVDILLDEIFWGNFHYFLKLVKHYIHREFANTSQLKSIILWNSS